jgi:arsenite-transporting ATPase
VTGDGSGYVLRIALPFAERDEIELGRNGAELLVRVGPHRRSMLLPDALVRRSIIDASLADGGLNVHFGAAP